ncbi:MAG TPA: hypothetical protein VGM10_18365 [Actinocrinis sp.]
MRADHTSVLRAAAHQLAGTRPSPVLPRGTFSGWVRAALAFQPAHPVPTGEKPHATTATSSAAIEGLQSNSIALDDNARRLKLYQAVAGLPAEMRMAMRRHPAIADAAASEQLTRSLAATVATFQALAHGLRRSRADVAARAFITHESRRLFDFLATTNALAKGFSDDAVREEAREIVRAALDAVERVTDVTSGGRRQNRAAERTLADDLAQVNLVAFTRLRALADVTVQPAARALGLDPQRSRGLGEVLLKGSLDDFTTADLSSADLRAVDLHGTYWSTWGTQWPSEFDVERLKSVSREIDAGIYLVEDTASSTSDVTTTA